jgi:dipeptidyl aminopeptidase/acylaminoacyl peptidase
LAATSRPTAEPSLVQKGIADPARLGITRGSYGGYMTMAGVTVF